MFERLEGREIRRRRASSARTAARRGIGAPDPGDRPRPDLPEGTDLLPQIRHIVIVMMENHSYDNYLGMLTDRGEGLPLGPDGNPDVVNLLPNGQAFRAHHMPSTTQVKNNPSQNWHASHIQYADGRCDGFAAAVAKTLPGADPAVPMGYWAEDDLPFYYGLARTFPLCDRWFSSCLGPTFPNRRFLIAGTANGSSILRRSCVSVNPIPRALSSTSGGTARKPRTMDRKSTRSVYETRTISTVRTPRPVIGSRIWKNAIAGIA